MTVRVVESLPLPKGKGTSAQRSAGWARLFGYDVFISFALGGPPRGSRSYASDLARRLRERGFTVFFSEDEAPVGERLDPALQRALARSRVLVVIANRGTLADPRWVRTEVESFRKRHPRRTVVPISVDGALKDPALAEASQAWLQFRDRIWVDETARAAEEGLVSDEVLDRLVTAPRAVRSLTWLRLATAGLMLFFAGLAAVATWQGLVATRERDAAAQSLLQSAAQRARLLVSGGEAEAGWEALVDALARVQPRVDGTLPDDFLQTALETRIEDRFGPPLPFDTSVPKEAQPRTDDDLFIAFDETGDQVAAIVGRWLAVWSTRDGRRRLQVRLDIAPTSFGFAAGGSVLLVEGLPVAPASPAGPGRRPAPLPGMDPDAPDPQAQPVALAVDVATGRTAPLPLALCDGVPCIAASADAGAVLPLSALPAFDVLSAGLRGDSRAFVATSAGRVQRHGTIADRFDLLSVDSADERAWWLRDRATGGRLAIARSPVGETPGERPPVLFAVAERAPRIAKADTTTGAIEVAEITGGSGPGAAPRLRTVRKLAAQGASPEHALTLWLAPDGKHLGYSVRPDLTGAGRTRMDALDVGRTAIVGVDDGVERWNRPGGFAAWGGRVLALTSDIGSATEVLDTASGTPWFSVPHWDAGATDPRQRRLVVAQRELEIQERKDSFPLLRLVEVTPSRSLARDASAAAIEAEGLCAALPQLPFVAVAEREARIWNRHAWQPAEAAGQGPVGAQPEPRLLQLRRQGEGWRIVEPGAAAPLAEADALKQWPELATVLADRRAVDVVLTRSPDGTHKGLLARAYLPHRDPAAPRAASATQAPPPEPAWPECERGDPGAPMTPTGVWRVFRGDAATPDQSGCIRLESQKVPGARDGVQFVPGTSWFTVPEQVCQYALHDTADRSKVARFMPVFDHGVAAQAATPGLMAVSSHDLNGALLALELRPVLWDAAADPTRTGPVLLTQASARPAAAASGAAGVQSAAARVDVLADGTQARIQAAGSVRTVVLPAWGPALREALRLAVQARPGRPDPAAAETK